MAQGKPGFGFMRLPLLIGGSVHKKGNTGESTFPLNQFEISRFVLKTSAILYASSTIATRSCVPPISTAILFIPITSSIHLFLSVLWQRHRLCGSNRREMESFSLQQKQRSLSACQASDILRARQGAWIDGTFSEAANL